MVKNFTRPGVVFFMIALASFVIVQVCWLKSLQEVRVRTFKGRVMSALANTSDKIESSTSWESLSDAQIRSLLHQSFSSEGLNGIHFTFTVEADNLSSASHPITRVTAADPVDMTLSYPLSPEGSNLLAGSLLTVIIPGWKTVVWKDLYWPFAVCGLLTTMVAAIFFCGWAFSRRRRHDRYPNEADTITRELVQQLETPLSTMAVAVEALGNAKVIEHTSQRQFYQDIIDAENARMNERVSKIFQEKNK